jgi:hypothetical protein
VRSRRGGRANSRFRSWAIDADALRVYHQHRSSASVITTAIFSIVVRQIELFARWSVP